MAQFESIRMDQLKKNLRVCPNGHRYSKSSDCPTCPFCEEARKPEKGFLSKFVAPARRALEREGIDSPEKLSTYTEAAILALHGIGPGSLPILHKALQEKGLSFAQH